MVHRDTQKGRRIRPLLVHLALLGVALLMVVPFYWMLGTSLKFD